MFELGGKTTGRPTAFKIADRISESERVQRAEFRELISSCPIPENEIHAHLGLFVNRQLLARMLWFHELYTKIITVPGVIMEFGVRWGQNLALFQSLRSIYEPYNYTRTVVGFDTFEGFRGTGTQDGGSDLIEEGAYGVSSGYEKYLARLLEHHERQSPVSHICKHALIKGDAGLTIKEYLKEHPETIISLAYFNMDIYRPTLECLGAIRDHLTKGSVIGFDELNCPHFPGETVALKEALGLNNYRLVRQPHNPFPAYLIIE